VQLSDEGFYICEAINFLGSDEVTVQFKTKPLEFLQVPPNFQNIIKRENVSLTCSAYGNPVDMTGKWTYSKSFWNEGSELKSVVDKHLNIVNVTVAATQSGVYQCQIKQAESIIKKQIYVNFATIESSILNTTQKKQLISWLSYDKVPVNFALCKSMSSYRNDNLKSKCGSKTETISIMKDGKGCIFGGYLSAPFDAFTVGTSFLFDFDKNTKFEAKSPDHVQQCSYSSSERKLGPCFGENDFYTHYNAYNGYGGRSSQIFYKSKLGSSYNDNGISNARLGCSTSGVISTMEVLYKT